jgi:phosphoribosylpyrophosphate synthetase
MAPGALDRIRASPLRRIVTTDSVPSVAGAQLQVVSVAPLLAGAVKRLAGKE